MTDQTQILIAALFAILVTMASFWRFAAIMSEQSDRIVDISKSANRDTQIRNAQLDRFTQQLIEKIASSTTREEREKTTLMHAQDGSGTINTHIHRAERAEHEAKKADELARGV